MRGLMVVLERLCAVSGLLVALGCASDAVQRDRGPRSLEPSGASLGAAAQRANDRGWRAVQGADFNLDGLADVLWNDPAQNLMTVWLMEGTRLLAPGPVIPGPIGDGWVTAAAADFNLDGLADVLWNNAEQNLMAVWLMEGTRLLAPGPTIPGPIGDGWVAPSAADFDHDGMADVLWNNAEQNLMAVWLMEGTRLLAPGPVIPGPIGDGWVAVPNLLDHNRDTMADVIWNNPEQNLMAIWLMEGTHLLAPGPLIPGPAGDGWKALAVGDANFDAMGDVVWNHAERNLTAVWLMEGSQLLAPGPVIPGPAGDGWIVVAANDFNGDGETDVLWTNAEQGLSAIWLMTGGRLLALGPVIPGPP
ncbi:FG-GAP repeat domain-containing protein [Sorangium sp. So ce341]|uniref:FG-GAP repeat domain-containing protein n=1 Tax=Sorangium sp. So ce341 TaxID=3133302 RepID=UPI003F5FB83E